MKKYLFFASSALLFFFIFLSLHIPLSYAINGANVCPVPASAGKTLYTATVGSKCNYKSTNGCDNTILCNKGLNCDTHQTPNRCINPNSTVVTCTCSSSTKFTCKSTPKTKTYSCSSNNICQNKQNQFVVQTKVQKDFPSNSNTVRGVACVPKPANGTLYCKCEKANTIGTNGFNCYTDKAETKLHGAAYCGSVHDICRPATGQSIDPSLIDPNKGPTDKTKNAIGTGWNVTGVACSKLQAQCTCVDGGKDPKFTCTLPGTTQKGGGSCSGGNNCTNENGFIVDTSTTSNYTGFLQANKGFSLANIKCAPAGYISPSPIPPPPSPPCRTWSNGICIAFGSTFGGFSTNPAGFIEKIFAVLLSVSGGIALLLIIKAGYQLMTAQGNPEKLNNGREQLVAAIVGLIFLIFSFVFLQLIGFDILHIPGFGGGAGATAQSCAKVGEQYCANIQSCYPVSSTCP